MAITTEVREIVLLVDETRFHAWISDERAGVETLLAPFLRNPENLHCLRFRELSAARTFPACQL